MRADTESALRVPWGDPLDDVQAPPPPEPLTAPEPPLAPPAEPEPGPPARPARPARRRGRTIALIACAAVLGVVAGVCTGYVVQTDRDPDPLPPLTQRTLAQAKGDKAPEPLSAAQDHRVKTDGDLRKLLVPRPSGAQKSNAAQGWLNQYGYADTYERPDYAFGVLSDRAFRRVAVSGWVKGRSETEIQLVQFHDAEEIASRDHLSDQQGYLADSSNAGTYGDPIPGSSNGRVYVYDRPQTKPGYLPLYQARALAARGDIVMDIFVYDTKPIQGKTVMALAKRQLERL